MKRPHRHSVWFDIFGVVAVLALLLAPLAYLASEMMGSGGLGVGGAVSAGGRVDAPRSPRPALSGRNAHRPGPLAHAAPIRPSSRPSRAESAVPFSNSWRQEATPDLSVGGSGSGAGGGSSVSRGGDASTGRSAPPGASTLASRSRTFGRGRSTSRRSSGGDWRGEAQRFAGRARALSNQLGSMAQESRRASSTDRHSENRGVSSAAGTGSQADNPPLPDEPTVPIDDHLHWLLAAGVLWGVWRLARG